MTSRGYLSALFVVLVACGHPAAWRPTRDAEAVLVDRNVVLRVEDDGTIGVIVEVTKDGMSAPGAIRLRGMDLQAARGSIHLRYARARAFQVLAAKLAATPDLAAWAARHGIAELGTSYEVPGRIDDSMATLLAAEPSETDSDERRRAKADKVCRVLKQRLRSYAERWRAEVR